MEYQKIMNFLDNTPNHPTKFRTKNWFEISDDAPAAYNDNSEIEFKTSILKSSFCDYSDAYILVGGTIEVPNTETTAPNNRNNIIIKNCTPFTDCVSEINNTEIDNGKDIDIVIPM